MKSDCLDYRSISGQNPLFLDYLFHPDRVRGFYPHHPGGLEDVVRSAEMVHRRSGISPGQMYPALEAFHRSIGAGERTMANLKRLQSGTAAAVVTGQQVGVFGGPALTVYKALSAVSLASGLRESGVPAVPVFWLASQDSDFEEVRSTWFFTAEGNLEAVNHPDTRHGSHQMAGTAPIGKEPKALSEALRILAGLGGGGRGIDLLDTCYRGTDFRTAFARWLIRLFADYGLVVVDPLLDFGSLDAFFLTAVDRRTPIIESLMQRTEELADSGYRPQVLVSPEESLLFLIQGDFRYKLVFQDGLYRAKGKPGFIRTPLDLQAEIENGQIRLGASALLRPILQDYLLPALVTIGGPAEVAYFAQTNAFVHFWDAATPILSRCGFTLVDHRSRRYLDRLGLTITDILANPREALMHSAFKRLGLGDLLGEFEDTERQWRLKIQELHRLTEPMDPPVATMLNNAAEKILYQLNKVRNRLVLNQESRDSVTSRQLTYLLNQLKPRKQLQERVLNFNSFYEMEGKHLLERLLSVADVFNPVHHLIHL